MRVGCVCGRVWACVAVWACACACVIVGVCACVWFWVSRGVRARGRVSVCGSGCGFFKIDFFILFCFSKV